MKIDSYKSIARTGPRLTILFHTWTLVILGMTGCSTMPDWSLRETQRASLTIFYGPHPEAAQIILPASNQDLLIEELSVTPSSLLQSFRDGIRRIHLPAGGPTAMVRCRYRLFRNFDAAGKPLAWPSPQQLFPNATRIEVDH